MFPFFFRPARRSFQQLAPAVCGLGLRFPSDLFRGYRSLRRRYPAQRAWRRRSEGESSTLAKKIASPSVARVSSALMSRSRSDRNVEISACKVAAPRRARIAHSATTRLPKYCALASVIVALDGEANTQKPTAARKTHPRTLPNRLENSASTAGTTKATSAISSGTRDTSPAH